jgi:hypothetical protein
VQSAIPGDLKSGDDEYELVLSLNYGTKVPRSDGPYKQKALRKQTTLPITTTWNTIPANLGPTLINEATQNDLVKSI